MNYEKEYKEAFKRAEKRFDPNPADGYAGYANGIIEDIFPQFIKREDERTRKEILDFIKHFWADHKESIPRISNWLAWLEKQKDANKAIEAVERIDKYIDQHLANAHDMKDSNPDKKYYRGWDDALGKMAGILQDVYSGEKQKESLRDFIDNFPYSDEQKEQKPIVMHTPRYAPPEQKPAEWSEDIIQKAIKEVGLIQHQIDWFKTNVFPPKQEWSEEDRLHYTNVLEALEYVKGCKSDYDKIEAVKSDIAWFKSLRYRPKPSDNWKPSEEQMKALLKVIYKARELHYTSIDGYTGYNDIRSLYEQLKKLM